VGGQLQEGRQPGELPPPVGDFALQDLAVQPGSLPHREIRILDRQLRQRRWPARGERRVEHRDLADQKAHRPSVARDVVHGQRDDMVRRFPGGGQPQQHAAQQRPAHQIEWAASFLPRQPEGLWLAPALRQARQVHQRQGERRRRQDHLNRRASPASAVFRQREHGAQRLVPAHDLPEAERQHPGVERPFNAQSRRNVVERAARFELVDEPEALLRE
jgi:hypothetical protein